MSRGCTARINEFEMYYEIHGEGEPLFLLHGMNGSGANWDLVFSKTIDGFQTIIPDLRGHGRSNNPARHFSIRQCARDVLALADELQVPSFKAIGLSLGGNTMLHVASMARQRVEAMTIVSATPYFPDQARNVIDQLICQEPGKEELARLRATHVRGDEQIAELRRYAVDMRDSHDDMNFTPPKLGTIEARTLIVHGEKDPLYPLEMPLVLYRAIPNSSLWILPDAGHGPVFLDNAPLFTAKSIEFLRK